MIARRWHGRVPNSLAADYLRLMQEVAVPDYRSTQGNRGAWCLNRVEGDVTHIEMLTFWDDFAAIKRFAGEDVSVAKYYDFDDAFLLEKEPGVLHFEVRE
jgi:hypothetical protein